MSQRELVQLAGRGDHDAFDSLAVAAIERLDAAARLILRDPERAKDAVQEAFARARGISPVFAIPITSTLGPFVAEPRRCLTHATVCRYDQLEDRYEVFGG